MPCYFKCRKLGEGTYATIFLAKEIESENSSQKLVKSEPSAFSNFVAIKKIKKTEYSQGQEISAIREIKALKNIKSEFVIDMKDIFIHKNAIHLVLEYIEFDLEAILKNKSIVIMPGDIKAWMHMLLRGLLECHNNLFIHRDIKPNNLLIKSDGTLKLADFGLTRVIDNKMTVQAITRWYRPLEMLLGASSYSYSADMWGVGAVFAEMFLRVPFFAADNDFQQIDMIFKALGTPSEKDWPLIKELPGWFEFKKTAGVSFEVLFSAASPDAIDLMKKLLTFDPTKRISCLNALKHEYFSTKPFATPLGKIPTPASLSK
jgi:cyclin-dependent kinase 7